MMMMWWWCSAVALLPTMVTAFVPLTGPKKATARFYRNHEHHDDHKKTQLTMPVLGPWVEQAPLLPGSILELKDITEMQQLSLQSAVDRSPLLASPVVALLDSYTPHAPDPGRYATLAAVLGYSDTHVAPPEYFMESSSQPATTQRNIHLLGIGRAVLTDLCYESTKQDAMDDEGYLLECEVDSNTCDNAVIVGHVQILQDAVYQQAPVQAITACAQLFVQISHWHSERQRLMRQIQAEDELFQDLDGIGGLFATGSSDTDLLTSSPRTFLERLDQYGVGNSVGTIQELTQTAMNAVAPYYSPSLLASEDFYYQMGSWAALAALSCYVEPPHLAWAVRCTDTTERLKALEDWMQSHVTLLQQCVATPNR